MIPSTADELLDDDDDSGKDPARGTPETREFYNQTGWTKKEGQLVDTYLFGVKEDGPIRRRMWMRRRERVFAFLKSLGIEHLKMAEFGCGGNPALDVAVRTSHYTAVDFSTTGLAVADAKLTDINVPHTVTCADMCRLPMPSNQFDAAYSAHAIYHIDRAQGQAAAFREVMRTVKIGGGAVFLLANPFPLLFPVRFMRRVVAATPLLGSFINKIRKKPPVPYLAMPLGWMRRQLQPFGEVEITCYAQASVYFDQHVTETRGLGRLMWRFLEFLELRLPKASTRLGNFVLITVRKTHDVA